MVFLQGRASMLSFPKRSLAKQAKWYTCLFSFTTDTMFAVKHGAIVRCAGGIHKARLLARLPVLVEQLLDNLIFLQLTYSISK